MTGSLSGIRVWDGLVDRGVSEIAWADGVLTEVRPAPDAGPSGRFEGPCVIPGLVDTHVHLLGFAGGRDRVRGFDTFTWPLVTIREEQALHAAANAQRAMRAGVTTLRDLGTDEAHALGMPVACHTHSAEGIAIAVEEGVDSIEHGTGMTADQAVELAARGISVAPTLLINDMIAGGVVPVPEESRGSPPSSWSTAIGTSAAAAAVRSTAGVLAAGRPADLVVMSGDPVGTVDDLRADQVVAVVCRGELVAGELPS